MLCTNTGLVLRFSLVSRTSAQLPVLHTASTSRRLQRWITYNHSSFAKVNTQFNCMLAPAISLILSIKFIYFICHQLEKFFQCYLLNGIQTCVWNTLPWLDRTYKATHRISLLFPSPKNWPHAVWSCLEMRRCKIEETGISWLSYSQERSAFIGLLRSNNFTLVI